LQKQIDNAFKAINDPVTNDGVFEIILKKPREPVLLLKTSNVGSDQEKKRRGRERDFHAFSKDTGDVLVVTIPGYHLDFSAGTGTAIGDFVQPSTFFGQHGYDPRLSEMKAIFYPAGPDFKRRTLKTINNVYIAPTVAELLGIKSAKGF
jgi:predicted AlkP superfamily pyrophosphatase or phosphodiesterase